MTSNRVLPAAILLLGLLLAISSSPTNAVTHKQPPGNDPGNNDPPPAGAILDLGGTPIPGWRFHLPGVHGGFYRHP